MLQPKRPPLGLAIKIAMARKDMRANAVAQKVGISACYLSLICGGSRQPSWGLVMRLALLLDLDLNAIVREE